jgi:hypothetical protein
MDKGKKDSAPAKDSPSVNLEHMQSSEGWHSGVQHPLVQTVKDPVCDTQAHTAALKDQFRREGRSASGGSAKRDKTGAKNAK